MRIEEEIKLDYSDVLFRPKRSTLKSRKEVDLSRTYQFKYSNREWTGIPIMASNMDGVGELEVAKSLSKFDIVTALTKQHNLDSISSFSEIKEIFNYIALSCGTSEKSYERLNSINNNLKSQFNKKKIWIASSTHANEEIFCAKTHIELKKKYKNLITIIIPRHVHRVKEIIPQINNLGLKAASHSSNIKSLKNVDVYIVDTFGETKKFYKIASSVFLGGSIIKRGGQNPLEAARYGAKIFHGPNIDNFRDVYKLLALLKVSKKVTSPKKLASLINFKKKKNTGKKVKKIGERILKKTIKEIDNLIINEFKKT